MKISIIVPTYNEEKYVGKTLESIKGLKREDGWEVEVLVIDADSSDKTKEIAKSYGAKVINIQHRGIGYAREQGVLHADGEILAFTDADTMVPEEWLVKHIAVLRKNGVVFSYGPFKVVDGKFPYYHFINYVQFPLWKFLIRLFHIPLTPGQNMAFWKKPALDIGGFNTELKVLEDLDFAIRMAKVGKTVFQNDLVVYSSGRRSAEGWRFFFRYLWLYIQYFLFSKKDLSTFPDFR